MRELARHLSGTYQPWPVQRAYLDPAARLQARLVRWAYPEIPGAAMAHRRATATDRSTAAT